MKKTRKTLAKITALALALCVILGAFPVFSASAAILREIKLDYDYRYGLLRESGNRTYGEVGARVDLYVFPNTGCLIDSFTVTDSSGREVEATYFGSFEGGRMYYITMPNSDINVTATFKVDNESGYYKVGYEYIGEGSATFSLNGLSHDIHYAKAGDAIRYRDVVAGEGYRYYFLAIDDYYTTSDGTRHSILPENTFYMPESDITITLIFEEAKDINITASGGTATSHYFTIGWAGYLDEFATTAAGEGRSIGIAAKPDEDHIDAVKFRIVSESGERLYFRTGKNDSFSFAVFDMPAEPVTAYVTFLKENYDVTCSAENGTLNYTAANGTGAGAEITLDPAPDQGFGLKELYYTYTPEVGMDEVRVDIDPNNPKFNMPEADVEVKAVFAPAYTVEWLNGDGSSLDIKTCVLGAELPETDKIPTKESTWECDYEFSHWSDPAYYTGNLIVFRPVFDKIYTVNISGGTAQPAKAKAGTLITLTPDESYAGMYHSGWQIMSGDFELTGNTFIMPESHVSLYATYALKKTPDINLDLSEEKSYVGKPVSVSGTVEENGTVLDLGGSMTITFSDSVPGAEGAVSYTVPVENGAFTLDVPELTAAARYVWAEYSGDGTYGESMMSMTFNVYGVSAAGLDGFYGEDGAKIYYNAGEALNTDKLVIWLFWMDGTYEEIDVTPDMVSGFDNTRSGWHTLTVTCPYPIGDELTYEVYVIGYILGDVNGDYRVDISDATAIQRHLAEIDILDGAKLLAADVDRDGEVNISDATHLQMFLAEFFDDSPIGSMI